MKKTQAELIAYYEKQLEKVAKMYGTDGYDALGNENSAYVEYAKSNLEAVKNGREW